MMNKSLSFLFILSLLLPNCPLQAGIEAGAAAIEITPGTSLRMAGFSARKEPSKGVLDPLFVRAMVLRLEERTIGFVVYDLIGTLGTEINEQLAGAVKGEIALNEIFFIATHSHAGPALKSGKTLATLPEYERELWTKTKLALKHAWDDLEPVRLGAGSGSVDLNYNRIKKLSDGRAQMIWENPGKEPLGPAEQTVYVLRFDDLEGQTKLLLANYACHPVILGSDNLLYSPDFPGVMCRTVERSHPDNPCCIFINGACGDMNPYFADANDKPAERVREVGEELAKEVIRVAGLIVTKEDKSAISITWKRGSYLAKGRWNLAKSASEASEKDLRKTIERLSQKMSNLHLPISVVLITPDIGFVGLPGEFFSSYQRMLRSQSPLKHLLVAGYTDGAFG
ncbi:MAG: neutral/alkaline non-lysosomal ceramidase N-terminal domain-containing protein, partial [bacterium]